MKLAALLFSCLGVGSVALAPTDAECQQAGQVSRVTYRLAPCPDVECDPVQGPTQNECKTRTYSYGMGSYTNYYCGCKKIGDPWRSDICMAYSEWQAPEPPRWVPYCARNADECPDGEACYPEPTVTWATCDCQPTNPGW